MVGCCGETRQNICGICEHTVSPKFRGGNMLHLMQLHFCTVHAEPCEKEPLLDHQCQMTAQAPLLSSQMHHCEVNSIYQKQDFPPPPPPPAPPPPAPPPPRECISQAETTESTQAHTRCQPGETQGETVLLRPLTPPHHLLLSKRREGVVVRGGYDGRWRGGCWFVIMFYGMFRQ